MNPPELYKDIRPWGEEVWLTRDGRAPSMVKVITVRAHEALSLQYHAKREEYWVVISGDGEAEVGGERIPLRAGASCFVPKEARHRVTSGAGGLTFVELSFGEFDEKDIVRLEDRYGRASGSKT